MKHKKLSQAQKHKNSPTCVVYEFGSNGSIDGADIEINGRYPEANFALNEQSDLVIRILSGSGKLVTKTAEATLSVGDVAFVEHGEVYYFEGQDLKLFMACTPAWDPAQYKEVK